jgi:hypothetical protein
MPDWTLLKKSEEYSQWWLPEEVGGAEIVFRGGTERPPEHDLELADYILNNLEKIVASAIEFMKDHLKMRGEYSFEFIEIFGEPDKYAAKANACFGNDDDGYLKLAVGLRSQQDFCRPYYVVVHY